MDDDGGSQDQKPRLPLFTIRPFTAATLPSDSTRNDQIATTVYYFFLAFQLISFRREVQN